MPKRIEPSIKLFIVELIGQNATAPAIIEAVAKKFKGFEVSTATVARLRAAVGMPGKPGRREGSEHEQTVAELDLYEPKLTLREKAVITGLSHEGVRKIRSDGN